MTMVQGKNRCLGNGKGLNPRAGRMGAGVPRLESLRTGDRPNGSRRGVFLPRRSNHAGLD